VFHFGTPFLFFRYLYDMSLQRAKNLVDIFNNGDFDDDIEPYFNDYITFFKFIKKYGLLDELDLGQIGYRDWDDDIINYLDENGVLSNLSYNDAPAELKNVILLRKLDEDYENTILFIINNLLTDVEIRNDGFYLYLKDREDLSNFYCGSSGRRDGVRHIAEQVFSEDGLDFGYYDSNSEPYETVTELDDANLTKLKDVIYKEVGNAELSLDDYSSDFFEDLSQEQGTPGYFRIRPEDLNDLLKDTDATNELFYKDLEEIGQELKSLYFNAENSAYESEIYEAIYGGLDEFFEGKIDEVPIEGKDGKTRYFQYIKIRDFVKEIKEFLYHNKGKTYSDSFLEYYGTYSEFLVGLINDDVLECIDVRIPDYPDYSMTQKNINEFFNDYI
jgi:hypothetical protein